MGSNSNGAFTGALLDLVIYEFRHTFERISVEEKKIGNSYFILHSSTGDSVANFPVKISASSTNI